MGVFFFFVIFHLDPIPNSAQTLDMDRLFSNAVMQGLFLEALTAQLGLGVYRMPRLVESVMRALIHHNLFLMKGLLARTKNLT